MRIEKDYQSPKQSNLLRVFPNNTKPPVVDKADGLYIYQKNGEKILDTTAGGTSYAIIGWNNQRVNQAIINQLTKFTHLDYKIWSDENCESLAQILVSKKEHNLNKVYFCGNSGSEACETALKFSYQRHLEEGKQHKKWFISRTQSYHGSTADALALGERPNLEFYKKMLSPYRVNIPMHHPLYSKKDNETIDDYAKRSAGHLEQKIIELGPENVSGFVGETIMGGLVGDVPPAPKYWKYIKDICKKYDVHLILDEVYCGTGTSGKIFCCDWDNISPDFIFIGKTLAAGYSALSAVITNDEFENTIKLGNGRIQHTSTHQGLSIGVAAALEVQKIIHNDELLLNVQNLSNFIKTTLINELADHDFFRDVRGRGLRLSFEYKSPNNDLLSDKIFNLMLEKYKIYISSKFHRLCLTPSLTINKDTVTMVLDRYIETFKKMSKLI
tara:strand:- start:17 stop:1342 length:1326 start_codon:yes stop_codon:yes gene_type:complete